MENVVAGVLNTRTIRAAAMLMLLVISGTSVAGTTGKTRAAHVIIGLFAGAVLVWTLVSRPKRNGSQVD